VWESRGFGPRFRFGETKVLPLHVRGRSNLGGVVAMELEWLVALFKKVGKERDGSQCHWNGCFVEVL